MPSIILSDNGVSSGSAGLKSTAASDGALALQTTTAGGTATNAVYVDTLQNVGLGTTPAAKLHLLTTGNTTADGVRLTLGSEGRSHNIYSALPTGRDLTIAPYRALTINTGSGTNEGVLTLNAYEYTVFGAGSSYTEAARLKSGGTFILQGGSTSATGTGITFPATQSASTDANTLDDYEEGSWTPTIYGASTAGTQSGTRSGSYVKIGRFVYMVASFSAFTLSGAAGNIRLGGLPFSMTLCGGMSVYLEGIDPVFTGTPDNNITLGLRFLGGTEMAFGPTVSNGWDSYMSSSTTWTGGAGASTYGNISFWGIANS